MKGTSRAARAWLTIQEASDLVGVSPATLRRWAEAGDVEAFVTPGGHRRFSRLTILGLLPHGARPRRRLRDLGETPDRIVRQYRRELIDLEGQHDWVSTLDEPDRASFRKPGRLILTGVLGFLDAATPDESEKSLATALEASIRYGTLAREHAVESRPLTDTFLRFRFPFLHELGRIARRRRLETDEAMDLLLAASRVFDRLLLAMLQGYSDSNASATTPESGTAPGLLERSRPVSQSTAASGEPA